MCARKLGRVKEAAKMFKELTKEPPNIHWLNSSLGENLIECYLEMGDYANAQVRVIPYTKLEKTNSNYMYNSNFKDNITRVSN